MRKFLLLIVLVCVPLLLVVDVAHPHPQFITGGSPTFPLVPIKAFTTADVSNSTTTMANITGLSWSVSASTHYGCQVNIIWSPTSAGAGNLSLNVTGPASPTSVYYTYETQDGGIYYAPDPQATAFNTSLIGPTSGSTTNHIYHAALNLILTNGSNSGTVQIQFASSTATDTVVVKQGSWGTCQ